jgi:PST family polysaccharide transporter
LLRVLSMVGALQAFSNPTGWIYVSQGRTDRMARWGFGACSAIIAALAIGASLGSSLTVAWAYLIVNLVLVPIGIWYAGDLIGLTLSALLRAIWPSILASAGMAAAVFGVITALPASAHPVSILVSGTGVGVISYVGLSRLLRNPALTEAMKFIGARVAGLRERFG